MTKPPTESLVARTARREAEKQMAQMIDVVCKGLGIKGKKLGLSRSRMIATAGDNAAIEYSQPLIATHQPTKDYGTGATPERIAKADGEVEPAAAGVTIRMFDGSVLDALLSRRNISFDQYNAGTRFHADWFNSGISGVGAIDLERPLVDRSGGATSIADIRIACAQSHDAAKAAVGPVHYRVLSPLLLEDEGLEAFGRRRFGYNNRRDAVTASIAVLRLALDHLVQHYFQPRKHPIIGSIREGYRPIISTAANPSAA